MLLDSLTGPPHRQQDERVGQENDGAGQCIAKEEKADDVRQSQNLMVGCEPVDAACGAIRFGTVMSPLCQGPQGKKRCITPHSHHQDTGM